MILAIIFAVLVISFTIITTNHTVYCFIFENEDWNLWKKYIRLADKFEYDREWDMFVIPNTDVRAYIWESGLCSIHWEGDCLCIFDTYHSKKMAKLLMAKIK